MPGSRKKSKTNFYVIIFLAIMATIYTIGLIFNSAYFYPAIKKSGSMFVKILPLLVLAFLVLFAINYFLNEEKLKSWLIKSQSKKGWLFLILAGILIAGPPYVLYPWLKEMKAAGMDNRQLALFLYNRNVKIPFLPVQIYYFGLPFTIILSLYIIIFSVINALLVGYWTKGNEKIDF